MPCIPVKLDNGAVALVKIGKGRVKQCHACRQPGRFLCDYPAPNGKTCDLPMCNAHRVPIGADRDFCPGHYRHSLEADNVKA